MAATALAAAAGGPEPEGYAGTILTFPDARLRRPCLPCAGLPRDEIGALAALLVRHMRDRDGAGLAAPQIGVPLRAFVLDMRAIDPAGTVDTAVFLDPETVWTSDEQLTMDEGCLSFPDIFAPVRRPARARVRATGLDGVPFEAEGGGLHGRALLHESDHLSGRLLIDMVGTVRRDIIKRKMRALARRG